MEHLRKILDVLGDDVSLPVLVDKMADTGIDDAAWFLRHQMACAIQEWVGDANIATLARVVRLMSDEARAEEHGHVKTA